MKGLNAAETALVRTLFRLYQHGAGDFRWSLVDAPPYDAILVDSGSPHLATEHGHAGVKAVLTLTRPLRSEMLQTWLLQTQREVFPEGEPATPAVEAFLSAESAKPADAPAPAATAPQTEAWKLIRWPPTSILRNDPTLIRMATMLSRRPMTLGELAQVSQHPVDDAEAFVLALRDAGLLVGQVAAQALKEAPEKAQAGSARITQAPRKSEFSLIRRIRLRLGL